MSVSDEYLNRIGELGDSFQKSSSEYLSFLDSANDLQLLYHFIGGIEELKLEVLNTIRRLNNEKS